MCFTVMVKAIAIECCSNGTHYVGRTGDIWTSQVHPFCLPTTSVSGGQTTDGGSELGIFLVVMISVIVGVLLGLRMVKCRRMLQM